MIVGLVSVLLREPNGIRVAGILIQAAVRLDLKASEALAVDIDRQPPDSIDEFLSKKRLTKLQNILNPREHHYLVKDKLHFHAVCALRGVPAPPILAVIDFTNHDVQAKELGVARLTSEQDLTGFLRTLPAASRLVIKGIEGSHGVGLLAVTMTAGGDADYMGRRMSPSDIWRHCRKHRNLKGFILQPWLAPDPALKPIMPSQALGTVRLVSVKLGERPQIIHASIKLPVGDNLHDNFSAGETGNITAGVDLASGRIGIARSPSDTRTYRFEIQERHPDTGVTIEGFQIPNWSEGLEIVREGADAFSELRTIGWDVAFTSSGIYLLEGNHYWDAEAAQVSFQRGIRSQMEAMVAKAQSLNDNRLLSNAVAAVREA